LPSIGFSIYFSVIKSVINNIFVSRHIWQVLLLYWNLKDQKLESVLNSLFSYEWFG
jgi:hypothetical protein